MSGTVVKTLSDKDRQLIEYLVLGGPEALIDLGMKPSQVNAFMERPEVKAALETINAEFNHQDVVQNLTRFAARRRLARLIPDSIEVLEDALRGPTYAREKYTDAAGNQHIVVRQDIQGKPIVQIPEPTRNQVKAATEVLDRTGVGSFDKFGERLPSMNLANLLKQENVGEVSVELDPKLDTAEQQSLSREKVRVVIEMLSDKVSKLRDTTAGKSLLKAISGKPKKKTKPKSKTKVSKSKKKLVKKAKKKKSKSSKPSTTKKKPKKKLKKAARVKRPKK